MIDVRVIAAKTQNMYRALVSFDRFSFAMKFDTGARHTVISAGIIKGDITSKDVLKIKEYCEKHCGYKGEFVSASGDAFRGYLTLAHDVVVDTFVFSDFYYYLVVENKRDIALLGYDFIDKCGYSHLPEEDIVITAFDDAAYELEAGGIMDGAELVSYMDAL